MLTRGGQLPVQVLRAKGREHRSNRLDLALAHVQLVLPPSHGEVLVTTMAAAPELTREPRTKPQLTQERLDVFGGKRRLQWLEVDPPAPSAGRFAVAGAFLRRADQVRER